jgi:hypothetical protein
MSTVNAWWAAEATVVRHALCASNGVGRENTARGGSRDLAGNPSNV